MNHQTTISTITECDSFDERGSLSSNSIQTNSKKAAIWFCSGLRREPIELSKINSMETLILKACEFIAQPYPNLCDNKYYKSLVEQLHGRFGQVTVCGARFKSNINRE